MTDLELSFWYFSQDLANALAVSVYEDLILTYVYMFMILNADRLRSEQTFVLPKSVK